MHLTKKKPLQIQQFFFPVLFFSITFLREPADPLITMFYGTTIVSQQMSCRS